MLKDLWAATIEACVLEPVLCNKGDQGNEKPEQNKEDPVE